MTIRKPRAWLQLESGAVNIKHAEVTVTRYGLADTFVVKMALDDPSNPGAAFWEGASPISASVVANNGDGSSGLQILIQGEIDVVEIDWDTREVTVQGSDKVAAMLDTRSDQHFPNMTADAIVAQIAAKHGLDAITDGDTQKAGKTYDLQNFAFNSDYENEWDVIQSLARHEGKLAYVVGNNLYFQAPGKSSSGVYKVIYTPPKPGEPPELNQMTLRTWRNLALENFTTLSASYHPYEKKPYTSDDTSPGGGYGNQGGSLPTNGFGDGFG